VDARPLELDAVAAEGVLEGGEALRVAADLARGLPRLPAEGGERAPTASPIAHSTGCNRKQPLVTWVVPTFLHAGRRFSTRRGRRAPSGIWKGRLDTSR
jgi:hypothetical protein